MNTHPGILDDTLTTPQQAPRVLLVDDDPFVLRSLQRVLSSNGARVSTASDGQAALTALGARRFDVVVSDIDMPNLDGVSLLREIKQRDLDMPVILITGAPDLDSAVHAVDYGALRYLMKPFAASALQDAVDCAVKVRADNREHRSAMTLLDQYREQATRDAEQARALERALEGLWVAFQPIVPAWGSSPAAYEALMRSREPSLPHPGAILEAAEQLGCVFEVGRTVRRRVAEAAPNAPRDALLFVNLHPLDLQDPELYDPEQPLSHIAKRVVLELTERESIEGLDDIEQRLGQLRALGFRLALDDMGSGYAGLSSLVRVRPDIAKIDMSLVRDVDRNPTKGTVVQHILRLCSEMHVPVVAEGIEREGEAHTLRDLGATFLQGYYFGRPEPTFADVPSLPSLASLT